MCVSYCCFASVEGSQHTRNHQFSRHHCVSLFPQLAARWRALPEEKKQVYLDQEAADRERFEHESAEADAQALARQEARRQALEMQDGEIAASRGARRKVEDQRSAKQEQQRKRSQHPLSKAQQERRAQQAAETAQRRKERRAQEDAVAKQHHKLDREEAKKASQRLDYLLQQSSIFSKMQGGKGQLPSSPVAKAPPKKQAASGTSTRGGSGIHHIHDKDSSNSEEDEDEDDETEQHVFLTKQPSVIKFGKLKDYQLEALNWMIHLAEKGLNGILADGTLVYGVDCIV